jgi:hypothetical protein
LINDILRLNLFSSYQERFKYEELLINISTVDNPQNLRDKYEKLYGRNFFFNFCQQSSFFGPLA